VNKRAFSLFVVWLFGLIAFLGCRPAAVQNDALLYPPIAAAPCSAYLSSDAITHDLKGYDAHFNAINYSLDAVWHDSSKAFLVIDQDKLLHTVYLNADGQVANVTDVTTIPTARVAPSPHLSLIAIDHIWNDSGSQVTIQSIGGDNHSGSADSINRISSPVWHSRDPLLAGAYYPKGYTQNELGTFSVATFDLPTDDQPLTVYEFEHYPIAQLVGWSSDGETLTVIQYRPIGVLPFHLQVADGRISESAIQEGCIVDAAWSPRDRTIAYNGQIQEGVGWDIFLETIQPAGEAALVNLTDTPKEDESDIAWSPDGGYLAYAKTFVNNDNELRQELFIVDPYGVPVTPRQLTDTADTYETEPMWLSDREIAYLSWLPDESAWYLMVLSTDAPSVTSDTILRLPESWVESPPQR